MSVLALALGNSLGVSSFLPTLDCPSHVKQACENILSRITFSYNIRYTENHFGDSYTFVIKNKNVFFCVTKLNTSQNIIKLFVHEIKNSEIITDQINIDMFLNRLLYKLNNEQDLKTEALVITQIFQQNIQDAMDRGMKIEDLLDTTCELPLPDEVRSFSNRPKLFRITPNKVYTLIIIAGCIYICISLGFILLYV